MIEPYFESPNVELYWGDAKEVLWGVYSGSVDCIVTSPPYFGLRDYEDEGQIGLEGSVSEYVDALMGVFDEAYRVLSDTGTFWLNLGDSYSGIRGGKPAPDNKHKHLHADTPSTFRGKGARRKNLLGIPWQVAFALQDSGWLLRNEIIWRKPNAMPESVKDRAVVSHEQVFLLTKNPKYFFNPDALREERADGKGTRAGRSVWDINTQPFKGGHFAPFPDEIPRRCILAGCPEGGLVLDPFSGSGTTGMVAVQEGRRFMGVDTNREYLDLSIGTRFKKEVQV